MRRPRRAVVLATALALTIVADDAASQRREPAGAAPRVVRAERAPALTATLLRAMPLVAGGGGASPRPAVTGGSGLARLGGRIYVVQDDSTYLAAIGDPGGATAAPLLQTLSRTRGRGVETVRLFERIGGADQFHDAFGNKSLKPDLEAIGALRLPRRKTEALGVRAGRARHVDALLVMGSGSIPDARDRAAIVVPGKPLASSHVIPIRPRALYARLRADARMTGGGVLNVEALAVVDNGETVRLFNRGNGPAGSVTASVDVRTSALVDYLVAASRDPDAAFAEPLENPIRYELGTSGSLPISIGDASPFGVGRGAGARELVVCALVAEDTDDPTKDGATSAASLGLQLPNGRLLVAPILDAGRPSSLKIEGLVVRSAALSRRPGAPARLTLQLVGVVDSDPDDPAVPSSLVEIALVYTGPL